MFANEAESDGDEDAVACAYDERGVGGEEAGGEGGVWGEDGAGGEGEE